MDPIKASTKKLLPKPIHLDNLVIGKNNESVVVRILRMWEAKNFKLNGTLMSLDILVLDEKETLIQASIYHRRIHRFKDLLKEGTLYQFSNFEVVSSYSHYKVTNNPYTIRFLDTTQVTEVSEEVCSIKREKFRIHSYAEFQSFAGTNLQLLDVVGQVLQVQGSNLDDSNSNQKIILLLLLQDNSTIRVTLWDDQASHFRQKFQQSGRDCQVVVCTCLNPKIFAGKLYLNSSGSTKLYFDYNLDVVIDFIKRMGIETNLAPTKIVEEDNANLKVEFWTISDIFEYISRDVKEEKEVVCRAEIIDINKRNGWTYLSCATCSRKLGCSETSLICNHCNKSNAIGVPRFRVELIVGCGERTTTFVLFDRDAKKLTQTTAEDITESKEKHDENSPSNDIVPEPLLQMIGKTMNFQIKISKYNFQSSFQTFTVTRVLKETFVPESKANSEAIIRTELGSTSTKKIKTEDGECKPTFEGLGMEKELGEKEKPENELSLENNDEKNPKKQRVI